MNYNEKSDYFTLENKNTLFRKTIINLKGCKCRDCGCTDVYLAPCPRLDDNYSDIHCSDCGSWIKKLSREDTVLLKHFLEVPNYILTTFDNIPAGTVLTNIHKQDMVVIYTDFWNGNGEKEFCLVDRDKTKLWRGSSLKPTDWKIKELAFGLANDNDEMALWHNHQADFVEMKFKEAEYYQKLRYSTPTPERVLIKMNEHLKCVTSVFERISKKESDFHSAYIQFFTIKPSRFASYEKPYFGKRVVEL
jgi:hypothetical protein